MQLLKSWPLFALLLTCGNLAFGQANTSLSNLVAPTAINADLLFGATGFNVGSGSTPVSTLYVSSVLGDNVHATTGFYGTFYGNVGDSSTPENAYLVNVGPTVSSGNGNALIISGGTGGSNATGGPVQVLGGTVTTGTGGNVSVYAGKGSSTNGDLIMGMPNNSPTTEGQTRIYGHIGSESSIMPAPSLSGCGTGGTISGSDTAGQISPGGGTATCTLNFGYAYATHVSCTFSEETARIALKVVPSSSSVTVSAAANFAAGTVLDYICMGWN